jgi:LPS-assembly protein
MTAILALALAGAATATAAAAPPLEVLEAGRVEYDMARERGVVTGGVALRRGAVILRAGAATYDARTGEVDATGGVLLTEPGRAIAASRMHAVLDGPFEAHDVVAFLKDAPLDLSRCRTLDEARHTGRTRVEVGGAEIHGASTSSARFEVERARITLCDCGGGPPSWEIRARHASVAPGKAALLSWPIVYVTPRFLFIHRPIPVLVLPAAYLPLSSRQSGLLFPEVITGPLAGVGVDLPLFLTFGPSWDATITPGWAFGPSAQTIASAGRGIKGPGLGLELRWAPAEGSHGIARLNLQHSVLADWPGGVARPPDQNRIALSFAHDERFSDRTYLKADVGLVDDPLYPQDFTGDALLRAAEYRRSAIALTHRRDDLLLELDAAYHLPLEAGPTNLNACVGAAACTAQSPRGPFGAFGADLSTFHRLPSASATLLPVRLAGPLTLQATVGVARFAPLRGATGDEGLDGIGPGERGWGAPAIDAGERDGRWEGAAPGTPGSPNKPGERLAATRALARVELRAPFTIGHAVQVDPWMAGTAAGYAFEAALSPQGDARAAGGIDVSTEVSRTFGSGASLLRHSVTPRVSWRAGTSQAGPGLPNYAYDEFDVALPARVLVDKVVVPQRTLSAIPGSFSQLQLSLRNRLVAPAGPLSSASLDFTLGQDLDAANGRPSETWAQTSLRYAPVSMTAGARFRAFGAKPPPEAPTPARSSRLDAFTELFGSVVVADLRGDNVHGSFIALGEGGSPRIVAGLEPFFDPRAIPASAVATGTVGVTAHVSGATASYDAYFNARDLPAPNCPGKPTGPHIFQHGASFVWDSPCHCWKIGVSATLNECDATPRFAFLIDLGGIGGGVATR